MQDDQYIMTTRSTLFLLQDMSRGAENRPWSAGRASSYV